ncbi:MAG: hypothetical protein ACPGU6_01190 [Tenacibaculum sp.]
MRKYKSLTTIFILLIVVFFISYNYVFKAPLTTKNSPTDFKGTSEELMLMVLKNNDSWLNKTVEISGVISNKDNHGFILKENIYCQLSNNNTINTLQKNQPITIKGKIIGYDDLLDELKLNQCIIKN